METTEPQFAERCQILKIIPHSFLVPSPSRSRSSSRFQWILRKCRREALLHLLVCASTSGFPVVYGWNTAKSAVLYSLHRRHRHDDPYAGTHHQPFEQAFTRHQYNDIQISVDKSKFFKTFIDFLRHTVCFSGNIPILFIFFPVVKVFKSSRCQLREWNYTSVQGHAMRRRRVRHHRISSTTSRCAAKPQ